MAVCAGADHPVFSTSNLFDRIDATTGAVTPLSIQNVPFPQPALIEALGLANAVSPAAVPEPPTGPLLLLALLGFICATWRRPIDREVQP
jgi:hypothetical protein